MIAALLKMATRDDDKISQCTAFLEQHQISAVLATCISAVLSAESSNLVAALADEVRMVRGGVG
jgi:predicted DNA-binding protein with PD1-like motif